MFVVHRWCFYDLVVGGVYDAHVEWPHHAHHCFFNNINTAYIHPTIIAYNLREPPSSSLHCKASINALLFLPSLCIPQVPSSTFGL